MKEQRVLQMGNGKMILFFLLVILCSELPAQKRVSSRSVRDTIYHKSGLIYHGLIRGYKKAENLRLKRPDGWTITFDGANIDSISWSDKSRLKFIDELVNFDEIPTIDVVYLKDGSILRGKILEYQGGAFLRFKIKSGTVRIEEADIQKIDQEPEDPLVRTVLQRQKEPKVYAFREKGWYGALGLYFLPGGGEYRSEIGFGLQASFGYRFRRQFSLGLGVSYESYAFAVGGDEFLPVFLEAQGYLWKKNNAPYWTVAAGYGFPMIQRGIDNQDTRRFDGGYHFHPAIGYRFGASKTLNLNIDIGYQFQKAITEREFLFTGDIITRDVLYRRLNLRMNVIF